MAIRDPKPARPSEALRWFCAPSAIFLASVALAGPGQSAAPGGPGVASARATIEKRVIESADTAAVKAKDPCAKGIRNPMGHPYYNHWDDKCTGPH